MSIDSALRLTLQLFDEDFTGHGAHAIEHAVRRVLVEHVDVNRYATDHVQPVQHSQRTARHAEPVRGDDLVEIQLQENFVEDAFCIVV